MQKNWVVAVFGTILQVLISIFAVYLLGLFFDWGLPRVVLTGFVISLSSTAVVLKLLEDWCETSSKVGQKVVGVLLIQDLIIVPMMIILGFWSPEKYLIETLFVQLIGGAFIIGMTVWLVTRKEIKLPWIRRLGKDHEMQVFTALVICFGTAFITGVTQLSAALGAFLGGMIVSYAKETTWFYQSLLSIRTVFMALFFVSIGMLINPSFLLEYWLQLSLLVLLVFVTNTFINAGILKTLGESWSNSIYGASLLSQIGEFSFIIIAMGYQIQIITLSTYQFIVTMIALTLLISPLWIRSVKWAQGRIKLLSHN